MPAEPRRARARALARRSRPAPTTTTSPRDSMAARLCRPRRFHDRGGWGCGTRAESSTIMEDPPGGLPAAGAPLGHMGPLHAERGVLAVARVDPGPVRQRAEHPLLEGVHPLAEPLRVMLGVAAPAR